MKPIKDHEAFFRSMKKGLQKYFDAHDKEWGGILHFTVGVKAGQVGGIIKGEYMLHYEGYTTQRVKEILSYVLPKYLNRADIPFAIDDAINELSNDKTPNS